MKHIIRSILLVMIISVCIFPVKANKLGYEYAEDYEVEAISIQHIIDVVHSINELYPEGDAVKHSEKEISNWDGEIVLNKKTPIYDKRGNNYMTIYELGKEGEDAGYLLMSRIKNLYPVLSFSDEGTHFYHVAEDIIYEKYKEKIDNPYIISIFIDSNLIYFIKGRNGYYNITSPDIVFLSLEEFFKIQEDDITEFDNHEIWELMLQNVSRGHSTPSYPILNPITYESGYDNSSLDYCSNMGSNYFIGTSFDNYLNLPGPCGHISMTNITMYWRRREPTYCASVATGTSGVSTYAPVFQRYYTITGMGSMLTSPKIKLGLNTFFHEKGITAASATIDNWLQFETDVMTEIAKGRPIAYEILGHEFYGHHWMTVFGWRRFKYGSTYHNYIRLADGYSSTSPNRYDYALTNNSRIGTAGVKFRVK